MNVKYIFASAAVASVLAFTPPARAQLLGGGLSGAVNGALSGGLTGAGVLGGLGDVTSTVTPTVRDSNGIGRAATQHAHEAVGATADAADRAAVNVDNQIKSTTATVDAKTQAANSAVASADIESVKPKLHPPKETRASSQSSALEPVKPLATEAVKTPGAAVAVQGSTSAQGNATAGR